MHKNSQILFVVLMFVLVGLCLAGSISMPLRQDIGFDPDRIYPAEQLREDFALLRTALEEGHAGLYYYSSKEEMDKHFANVANKLDRPMTEPEFNRLVAGVIARINDGHTGVRSSAAYDRYLSNQPCLFPFSLRFVRGSAYLFRNYSEDPDIELGWAVLDINERPISEILEHMFAYMPSDGRIETSKYRRLESTEYFGTLYSLLSGVTTSFTVTYADPGEGTCRTTTVEGLRRGALSRIFQERYPAATRSLPPLEVEYRGDTAVLTIRTFSDGPYRSIGQAYPTLLRKTFKDLEAKSVENLIVDLRENGGGADLNGKLLVSYLMDKPYMFYTHLEVMRDSFSFLEHTDTPEMQTNLKKMLRRNEQGTFDLLFHPNLGEQKPMQPSFRGKVFVLISGRSFSGSGECTSILHFHKRAKFVGEECGAGYYGNTSGFMPQLTLPHSGLRIRLAMLRYHMAVSGYELRDRGIIPDYPFTRSIQDLLLDRDTELEYALELIRK
ncbi:MAG: S41 family peptidase [Candidatus Aminicenantaceae bacterium]